MEKQRPEGRTEKRRPEGRTDQTRGGTAAGKKTAARAPCGDDRGTAIHGWRRAQITKGRRDR